jgi:predicted HTH domain antitoxin
MNATVEMTIPEGVTISETELKMIVAAKLFEMGEVSSGQAAQIAGVSKREFLESVGKYGVSIFGYDSDELKRDLDRL